jgi:hypothetical protein
VYKYLCLYYVSKKIFLVVIIVRGRYDFSKKKDVVTRVVDTFFLSGPAC